MCVISEYKGGKSSLPPNTWPDRGKILSYTRHAMQYDVVISDVCYVDDDDDDDDDDVVVVCRLLRQVVGFRSFSPQSAYWLVITSSYLQL